MMKNKFLLPLLAAFIGALFFAPAYPAWVMGNTIEANQDIQVEVPEWTFGDIGFAKIENLVSTSYLSATQEESITQGSTEAIRFTNTAGTQTKDHVFIINLDKEYDLYDIATCKIEFDYYHAFKREQNTKGFPKLQLYYDNTSRGAAQGGDETVSAIAPYTVTDIDSDWWHLEYYITSMCPIVAGHQDTPQSNYKINRIRFTDKGIYNYGDTTAFVVIDNLVLTDEPGTRLGLFNRTSSDTVGKWFWLKVAWSGELHSCVITTSDPAIAVQDTQYVFYVKLLSAGTVDLTATLEIGSQHQVFSITKRLTVTN